MKTSKSVKKEIKEGAPFALLSYVLFLWILTFIFQKDNRFALFHARQGLVIFLGNVICLPLIFIPVFSSLFVFLELVLVVISLYGMYLSVTARCERIYLISDIADRLVI
tara:strand:- start:73 stop:399 length:327 start_codon:yes stop_codon:yes gene_type:complete